MSFQTSDPVVFDYLFACKRLIDGLILFICLQTLDCPSVHVKQIFLLFSLNPDLDFQDQTLPLKNTGPVSRFRNDTPNIFSIYSSAYLIMLCEPS